MSGDVDVLGLVSIADLSEGFALNFLSLLLTCSQKTDFHGQNIKMIF